MENAADALKIAFAIFVFVIALTALFQTASFIQSVAETRLITSDKTTYYEYYDSDESSIDDNGNRIVTLEDIIPTMYRYSTESAAVTIIDDKTIVTRLDRQTETLCTNWNSRTEKQKQTILNEINYILKPVGVTTLKTTEDMYNLFKRIYKQNANSYHPKEIDCPWNGIERLTAQRIDSDLSGITAYFSINDPGSQNADTKSSENHVPCLGEGNGIIGKYKNSRFTEYLILYDTNNYIVDEEEGDKLYSSGELMNPIKREVVYVYLDEDDKA